MVVDAIRSARLRAPVGHALAASGLLALFFGYHFGPRLPVSTDISMLHLQFFALRYDGSPPLWNPYSGLGMPMSGDLQFAALYPPRWPFFFLPWDRWLNSYLLIHYLVALLGTCGLLHSFGLGRVASFGGAVAYLCGGFMMAYVITLTVFCAACWLPVLLWGASTRRAYGPPLAGSALAMIILIGSPHMMFYGFLGWLVFQAIGALGPGRSAWTSRGGHLGRAAIFLLLGIAAGGASLVPGLIEVLDSVRLQSDALGNLDKSMAWNEPARLLFGGSGGAVYPEVNDRSLYVGGVGLLLMALGTVPLGREDEGGPLRRLRAAAAGLILIGAVFALGKNIGWQFVLPYVPGLALLAGPSRALVLAAMGLAMLVALGLEAAAKAGFRRVAMATVPAAAVVALVLGLQGVGWEEIGAREVLYRWWRHPDTLVGAQYPGIDLPMTFVLGCAALLARPALRHRTQWILAALLIAQLLHFAPRVRPRAVERNFFDAPANIAWLAGRPGLPPFRVSAIDPLQATDTEWDSSYRSHFLQPNISTLYRIEAIGAYNPLQDRSFQAFVGSHSGLAPFNDPIRHTLPAGHHEAMYRELDVRYVIGDPRDRRVTHIPTALYPDYPVTEVDVQALADEPAIGGWQFVSFLAGEARLEWGTPVAELIVQSGGKVIRHPIRYGVHTAYAEDVSGAETGRLPPIQSTWRRAGFTAGEPPSVPQGSFRSGIGFEPALRVDRVFWRLLRSDVALQISAQAVRRSLPIEEEARWALRFTDPVAPVYEYLNAPGRVRLLGASAPSGTAIDVDLAQAVPADASYGERLQSRSAFRVNSAEGGLLVIADAWHHDWRAWVDGERRPLVRVNALFQGVHVTAGNHEVALRFVPSLFYLLCVPAAVAGSALAFFVVRGVVRESKRTREEEPRTASMPTEVNTA